MLEPDSHGRQRFTSGEKTLAVERVGATWRLSDEQHVVETRDLSAGVDELLGKGRSNLKLVVCILEWEAGERPANSR
jgi:hypothetical protein